MPVVDYILGAGIFALFTVLFYGFGSALRKNAGDFAPNLVIGYIAHSFLIAITVVPIQLLELTFTHALVAVVGVLVVTASYTVVIWHREKLAATALPLRRWLKENYFIFVVAALLFLIYLLQLETILDNNRTDDGYYLLKVANMPYVDEAFNTTYGTGFEAAISGFNSYHLSSVQTEMAVYVYLAHIDPVIFTRGVLNIFHYFLAAASVTWFASVLGRQSVGASAWMYQYFSSILLLFAFENRVLDWSHLLVAHETWRFNTAMWFGDTLVRVLGIVWIITPFLHARRIGWKEIGQVVVIGVALVSKAAAAIPVVAIAGLAYLFAVFFTGDRRAKGAGFALLALLGVLGWRFAGSEEINVGINNYLKANLYSPVMWGAIIAIVIVVFTKRTRVWDRLGIIIVALFALIAIPELNDFFETVSFVSFVGQRAQTAVFYTVLIAGFVALGMLIVKVAARYFRHLQVAIAGVLALGAVVTTIPLYGSPITSYRFMAHNPQLIPAQTAELSQTLEEMAAGEWLDVLAPEWVEVNNLRHYVAAIVRVYAPHVHSISALTRFGTAWGSDYYHWDPEEQGAYDTFIHTPSEETYLALQDVLDTYPVDVVVIPGDFFEPYKKRAGFELADQLGQYYIYRR